MNIVMIRHGQTNFNVEKLCNSNPLDPVFLTEKGISQIKKLKNQITFNFDIIIISELPRTLQSAVIMNEDNNKLIIVEKRLNDRKTGYEKKSVDEFNKLVSEDKLNAKLDSGESFQEEFNRVTEYLNELKEQIYNNVLIIAHNDTLKIGKAYSLNQSAKEALNYKYSNSEYIQFNI